MTLWMVRAGRSGERESFALEENVVTIGWSELPDLAGIHTREELLDFYSQRYPDEGKNTALNRASQVWTFVGRIKTGDWVILPLKQRSAIAVGRVTGPYKFEPDFPEDTRHTRPVEWLKTDIPRAVFGQDLLYSLGAFLTVCRIKRNNAEARVEAIVRTGRDPGLVEPVPGGTEPDDGEESDAPINLEGFARDQVMAHITTRFRGNELTRLVAAALGTQGYQTLESPAGPDGGVDIIAGQGPMGFDPPRLCVQVKSGDSPADVRILRELQGTMPNFGAEHGLLVSWGGFTNAVYAEARQKYFQLRLWDAGDLVTALLDGYDRLSEDIQAELPLKRIWTLVREEE